MKSLTWPIHFHPDEKMSFKRNKHPPEWPQILRWKSESESVLCFFPPGLKNNTRTTYKLNQWADRYTHPFFFPLDIESQPFSITADVFPTFQRCGPWSVPALWSHTCTRRGAQWTREIHWHESTSLAVFFFKVDKWQTKVDFCCESDDFKGSLGVSSQWMLQKIYTELTSRYVTLPPPKKVGLCLIHLG